MFSGGEKTHILYRQTCAKNFNTGKISNYNTL